MPSNKPWLAPKDSCTLELCGAHLFYVIVLDSGWVSLNAQLMDAGDKPELLVTVADGPEGWRTICRLVAASERSGLQSLARSIEIGTGVNGWVIA